MDFLDTASEFLSSIFNFIILLFDFLVNNITNITKIFDYITTYVFEIPTIVLSVFNNLPDFMQLGFQVIFGSVIFIFVLKIIKIIRDCMI